MRILTLAILTVLTFQTVQAQSSEETDRSSGITASVQSQQLDMQIPIWLNDRNTLAPVIGVVSAQDVGTDLTLGLVYKIYQKETIGAVPFISLRGGAVIGIPSEGDSITDFIVGIGYGGEYFFDPKFSIGVELQGNAFISDEGSFRFGNPGNINFNTASVITASIYF